MVYKAETEYTRVHEPSLPVTPAKAGDKSREEEAHEEYERNVVLVLPPDDRVLGKVGYISNTRLAAGLDKHPTDVRIPEPTVSVVRVEVGVGVTVVGAVTTRPPLDRAFGRTGACDSQHVLKWLGGIIRPVCPKTVVASGDTCVYAYKNMASLWRSSEIRTETRNEVVDGSPDGGLCLERSLERTDDAENGDEEEEETGEVV